MMVRFNLLRDMSNLTCVPEIYKGGKLWISVSSPSQCPPTPVGVPLPARSLRMSRPNPGCGKNPLLHLQERLSLRCQDHNRAEGTFWEQCTWLHPASHTSSNTCIGVSASASVLPMNTQDWYSLEWTGLISLKSKGLSKVFSSTTVWKHCRLLCPHWEER